MRLYTKPELRVEVFDVEDVITASSNAGQIGNEENPIQFAAAPFIEEPTEAAEKATMFPQSTVVDPSGAFRQEVTGGNIVQEGLNNLYENFLSRF